LSAPRARPVVAGRDGVERTGPGGGDDLQRPVERCVLAARPATIVWCYLARCLPRTTTEPSAANTHDSMLLEAVVDAVAVESSGRLGRYRYVVERSLAWLVGNRRLAGPLRARADVLLGFLYLSCALVCLHY
jgi:hypothetical protein